MTDSTLIADGLELRRVYWVRGSTPKGTTYNNRVSDPPHSGWGHALLIVGEKRGTLFCPFTFEAFQLRMDAAEIAQSLPCEVDADRIKWFEDKLLANWKEFQTLGLMKDYDTAALIMKRMGMEPPADLLKGGEEDTRTRGGKESLGVLLKPVKRKGKRGNFLQYFLDNEGSRSVREVMAEMEMTRSNVLSYLYTLNKDHGIGYHLVGDTATLDLPEGDLFDE